MFEENLEVNESIKFINTSQEILDLDEFTVVVTGLGRSGTSMLARMLSAGKIPMGRAEIDPIHEDLAVATAIESGDKAKYRTVIDKRNSLHKIWGFKRPLVIKHQDIVERELRNPRFVIIFRDPLAVASRNVISMNYELRNALIVYQKQNGILTKFISTTNCPILALSYEKTLFEPKKTILALSKFAKIDSKYFDNMENVITPNNVEYNDVSKRALERMSKS